MSYRPTHTSDAVGARERRPGGLVAGLDSDDEDLSSDDDLSETDIRMLNTDYASRDFGLYPAQNQARNESKAADDDDRPLSEKYRMSSSQIPPRRSHAYQYPRSQPRPLIDYIKNEWREAYLNPTHSQVYDDRYDPSVCLQMCFAPRMKRIWLVGLAVFFLVYGNWKFWVRSSLEERLDLRESALQRMQNAEGWFGANLRPEFNDMVNVDNLDAELLPQGSDSEDDRRLMFIGDVHGCNDELHALLTAARYRPKTDHLVFLGDMIAKGPSSAAVVDLAISHNASCVRGNHEDRILLTHRDLTLHSRSAKPKPDDPPAPGIPDSASRPPLPEDYDKRLDDPASNPAIEEFSRLDITERALASELKPHHIDYLSHCPTILDLGSVPNIGRVHVVHAGLIPHVDLERQDPLSVMEMRTVDLETHVPSSNSKGVPWFKLWNKYQDLIPSKHRATVIYGHDSKRGLQLHKYTKGLDTGCVRGGKLTALVMDGKTKGAKGKEKAGQVFSVPCKDYRKLETEVLKQKPVG